jgi:release factor glutamine methyltransferase
VPDPLAARPGPPSGVFARLRASGCVFAEDEAELLAAAATGSAELDALVAQRVAGLPLEHLLGWAEFCGLRIAVGPGVFVPRRRTAFLVQQAAALAPDPAVVVDLCCGSGAVGAALLDVLGTVELVAADVDPVAVRYARRNVEPRGGRVVEGDLDAPLPAGLRGRVDVLVANVPYVPTAAIALMPPEARDHEQRLALDGGADGVDLHRRIAAEAPEWLAAGGVLIIETSPSQAPLTERAMHDAGLVTDVQTDEDIGGCVVVGVRPGERA